MIKLMVIIAITFLFGCANTNSVNKELANKNLSIVKSTRYVPYENTSLFNKINLTNISEYSYYFITMLNEVNGKKLNFSYEPNEIQSGENNLLITCRIGSSTSRTEQSNEIKNTVLVNVNLEKGHVYNLKSILVEATKNTPESCNVKVINMTTVK